MLLSFRLGILRKFRDALAVSLSSFGRILVDRAVLTRLPILANPE